MNIPQHPAQQVLVVNVDPRCNDQLVLGCGKRFSPNCRVLAEYVRSLGFAPRIDILTISDRDVVQNTLVLGLDLGLESRGCSRFICRTVAWPDNRQTRKLN